MIECTGTESYATECIVGTWKAEQQTRSLYLSRLHCFEFLVTGLRLQGGVLPNEGRFEVKVDGRWGTVCVNARAWGSVSEDDLCRLLGYVRESLDSPSMTTEHFDDTEEVWMSYPRCNSTNTDINGCSKIKGVYEGCNVHTYDMYLKCDPVQIVDGAWPNSGRIEAGIRGQLQSFCETGIDMEVANITCNILGYNGAKTLSSGGSNGSSVYSGRVECKGTESSLENCNFIDDTNINCKESGVAYITCQGGPAKIIPFDKKPYEGVFVHYYMNEWRHIGTAVSDTTAETLCNILGFGSEGYAVMIYGEVDGGTDIFESMVCKGNESEVAECVSGLYKQQTCYDYCNRPLFGAVALYCADYEIDSIRLVNGLSNREGAVQVLVDGVWGYVCATEWNTADTNVACKTRGFTFLSITGANFGLCPTVFIEVLPSKAILTYGCPLIYFEHKFLHVYIAIFFRSGLGYRSVQSQNATVLIGHLQCTGSESHLNQCTYKKKGHYDHSESCSDYVYVTCTSECRQGFYGDQCLPCECNAANTKSCDILSGGCFCVDGWTGNSCSDDIDECATVSIVCPTNKNCVNSPGSYTCECELGFMEVGDTCKGVYKIKAYVQF
ncbi:neurotrypsin-like [Mercenaria mercenaria]|uniref:neurotrypsin-like n=1 Tax=Mercenaria mercenaria TaxID=6596 RepID=UPI00234E6021|nr:neurotrypsin-like [Mercenaria mercenaria]